MKFRKSLKITTRTSSITNSFVQAIIPDITPSTTEIDEVLNILDMTRDTKSCVYCGAQATDWDHLRPLVRNKKPTGYLNEARNVVPSCGPCNQSKSGADWQKWMEGSARGSPRTKGVTDLAARIERLKKFEQWGKIEPLLLHEMIPAEQWDSYWALLEEIENKMKSAQAEAEKIKLAITQKLHKEKL